MFDKLSGSYFWDVDIVTDDGETESVIVQTAPDKDAEYVSRTLKDVHPEYISVTASLVERPAHLKRCYGDPY